MSLRDKSLSDLRAIAQGYGVENLFEKDAAHLIQAIELKQEAMIPTPKVEIPRPEYDARLMLKAPSRRSSKLELDTLLQPYVDKGMHVSWVDEETWHFQCGKKEDTGTLRQPLRNILSAADKVMG